MEYIIDSEGKRRKATRVTCNQCDEGFLKADRFLHKGGNRNYCSRPCSEKARARSVDVVCAKCNKEFKKKLSHLGNSKSGLYFCTRRCKDEAQKLGGISEIQPPHYGQGDGSNSYRKRALDHYPHECNRCPWDAHVEVLQVHHKDRNRENNDLTNLEVLCPTCHYTEHFLEKDGMYWTI